MIKVNLLELGSIRENTAPSSHRLPAAVQSYCDLLGLHLEKLLLEVMDAGQLALQTSSHHTLSLWFISFLVLRGAVKVEKKKCGIFHT